MIHLKRQKRHYPFLVFFLCGFLSISLYSQHEISGTVIDGETQHPLPFANIQGLESATITDNHGNFILKTSLEYDTIEVTYLGFNTLSIPFHSIKSQHSLGQLELTSSSEQLNTVTITSGKFKKRIQDVTVSMEILQPGLLERNHIQSFSDILDKIPGVNYIDGQVNIRGGAGYSYGAGSRVMLLIDNIPALTSDAAFANWSDIPIETIAQVEVLKGAGSALYGSAAMNGVINILTKYAKKEAEFNLQVQGKAFLSPADSLMKWWDSPPYQTNISSSFSKKFGDLSLVAAGYLVREESFRKDTYNNYGRLNLKLDYALRDNLVAGLTANLNQGKSQTFFYWKNDRAGAYLADSINYSSSKKTRYTLDPRLIFYGPRQFTHRLTGRIYGVSNESDNDQSNFLTSFYGEYQAQKKWEDLDLVATSGWVSQLANINAPLYGDTSFLSLNHAYYLQVEKKFFERLSLNMGGRYEINKISGPSVINGMPVEEQGFEGRPVFRAGMNFKLFPYTNFRASWGQGYRYPSIAEKYISTTAGILNIVPNPSLKSETGWTAEIGLRQGFGLGNLKGYIDASAFRSRYDDMMEFNIQLGTFPPKFSAQNIGNTDIKGLEFSGGFTSQWGKLKWELQGGYVYIDPAYRNFSEDIQILSTSEENILKYRNKHSATLNTQINYSGLSLGVGSEYRSFMEAIDAVFNEFIPGVKSFRAAHAQGTQVWYGHLGYETIHWDISLRMDNIFNAVYTNRPAKLEAPRSLSMQLKYKW
jgi:outer membrane receptor protein involved in Fe transport